ncbi:MAG TPA: pyridoxamine 5'-phosphate oxidase [Candidatus Polarisedimenticolaceae bacterium]|nr:pyridoxamine 5'-phosphate oxidase [Candidatus Polarisedimenticolaceae bacterium]
MDEIPGMRRDYLAGELSESTASDDPLALFETWFDAALKDGLVEPTAAALATCGADGQPSCRMVLLKGADRRGFVVFSNAESRKGLEMTAHPQAALTLWWDRLERQVRIEGKVERVADSDADDYHASRPRASQIAAWASAQSRTIRDRAELDARFAEIEKRFQGRDVPRPTHWGGFRIVPHTIEFWQGRRDRLHDRIVFRREGDRWARSRLSP